MVFRIKPNIFIYHFLLIIVLLFSFYTGFRGIDYGHHWDELKIISSVKNSFNTGIILPHWYHYPSMCYNIALITSLPKILLSKINYQSIKDYFYSKEYLIHVRTAHLIIVLLSAIWIYRLVYLWRESLAEALLSSVLLCSSWEVAYHARWFAADGILMQFTIFTFFLIFLSIRKSNQKLWLRMAAITAGLSCGSKYPGGALLIPLLLTNKLFYKQELSKKKYEYLILIIIFTCSYLITTPGTLLEPFVFFKDVKFVMGQYWSGWNDAFTVGKIFENAYLSTQYFSFVLFSNYWPVSILFFCLMIIGFNAIVNENKSISIIFLSLPIFYLFYMLTQSTMIVRNYLILVPFMAILSARGYFYLFNNINHKPFNNIFICILFLALFQNFNWLHIASQSIVDMGKNKSVNIQTDDLSYVHGGYGMKEWANKKLGYKNGIEIGQYIIKNKDKRFILSEGIKHLIPKNLNGDYLNITSNISDADEYIFLSSYEFSLKPEIRKWFFANRFNRYKVISGPYEVNINYYPIWAGDERAISIPVNKLKDRHI